MAEYIEREALIKLMQANFRQGTRDGCDHPMYPVVEETIMEAPAADVAPVRHGEWLLKHIGVGHYWECSVCHAAPNIYITEDTTYCPNCGAKMDLKV